MSEQTWKKSCNVVVHSEEDNSYRLRMRGSDRSFHLNVTQADAWFAGDIHGLEAITDELQQAGFILETPSAHFIPHPLDNLKLALSRGMRFYSESPELNVLFNSRSMQENNPLLVLGPYGSVIWNAIINDASIGEIRRRVVRMFGADEVVPFLKRLMNLGFLALQKEILEMPTGDQHIIKEFFTPEIQFMLPHSRIPWYCIWEISTLCDTRCQICYLKDYQTPGPEGVQLETIIDELDHMGVFYVTLLGGEAMLRPDLETIIARLRGTDIFVKLVTNGNLLTVERAKMLRQANLNHLEISFDGLTADSHEQSRAPGTFRKAQQAVHRAQDAGIPRVGMVFTLYAQNFHDLPQLPSFMRQHKITECYISMFRKTGLMGSRSAIQPLPSDKLPQVYRLVKQWKTQEQDLNITLLPLCTCGHTSAVIGADMSLRPCTFSYHSAVGKIGEHSLADLWARMGEKQRLDTVWCEA